MTEPRKQQLYAIAADPTALIGERIAAVKEIAADRNPADVSGLTRLLSSHAPALREDVKGWDPRGAERLLDLHIIEALSRLGDHAQLYRLGDLVAQAGRILQGPDDELVNAAAVIRSIGRIEPLRQVVNLTSHSDPAAVENAVRVLELLDLPFKGSGEPVDGMPELSAKVTFEIHRLQEELGTIAQVSDGRILLSHGVRDFIQKHDYERGDVSREDVTLAAILTEELQSLGFTYYVEDQRVVICTYEEAGRRWRSLWSRYGERLAFDADRSQYVLQR